MKKCFEVINNLTKFRNFTCTEIKTTVSCKNNPTIIDGTLLIDKCDSIYRKINLTEDGYRIITRFKPLWNPDNKTYYILDVSKGLENNRISLFTENNFLKLRIYQDNGTEVTIKKRIDKFGLDWKNTEWYRIEMRWWKPSGKIFLNVNGKDVVGVIVGKINLNLKNAKLFLGSDMNGENQAFGYFDYIVVAKYVYPELTIT